MVVEVSADAGPPPGPLVDVAALSETARAALAPYARTLASAPPPTFYTWTTPEQITELSRDRVLLTRENSPGSGVGYYERAMEAAAPLDPIAALLRTKAFSRLRFAWSAPWATSRGWDGETYGNQLIGVTLKPEAWIAVYTSMSRTAYATDTQGRLVPVKEALKRPERLAAVLFVHDDANDPRAGYREYVLCNESMIAKFSVGTDEEKKAIGASVAAMKAFSAFVEASPRKEADVLSWNKRVKTTAWRRADPASNDPYLLFEESLAMPASEYLPDAQTMHEIVDALEDLPAPAAHFTHTPKVKFNAADGAVKRAPPPPPVTRPSLGTF